MQKKSFVNFEEIGPLNQMIGYFIFLLHLIFGSTECLDSVVN